MRATLLKVVAAVGVLLLLAGVLALGRMWWESRLPGTYNVMDFGSHDFDGGVTIHWHGVDVPNAEDGVAGVTQNAVMPGGSYTYRFRPDQQGTSWYHTHQSSAAGTPW